MSSTAFVNKPSPSTGSASEVHERHTGRDRERVAPEQAGEQGGGACNELGRSAGALRATTTAPSATAEAAKPTPTATPSAR